MMWSRRNFLAFMGLGFGASLVSCQQRSNSGVGVPASSLSAGQLTQLPFKPVSYPIPLTIDGLSPEAQKKQFATFVVRDDLVLPGGYRYEVLAQWGDPVGDGWFGFNNDYLGLVETNEDQAFLAVNFEYISLIPWRLGYESTRGKSLPFEAVIAAVQDKGGAVNALALSETDPLRQQIQVLSGAGLSELGVGVMELKRDSTGGWQRHPGKADRRITGLSGLRGGPYLTATGPVVAVFENPQKQGYEDNLGNRLVGTIQNCAGGTTPWGTVLSAEENFQDQVTEAVYADGSSLDPAARPFAINKFSLSGLGNVFGLAGNKYGWMVEVDPSNPNDYGRKHTGLGRFRHEAVAIRAETGKPIAVYSGCDRRSGHIYKFVSQGLVRNPQDKGNSELLTAGKLYGAQFNPDGTGQWIELAPHTPIAPIKPSQIASTEPETRVVYLPNPDRDQAGAVGFTTDRAVAQYQQQFKTLADLYPVASSLQQGAILVDAHFAANAVGITPTARPEDTEVLPDGSVLFAFTSGLPSRGDGGCDRRIFRGPNGESPYASGWIMKIQENQDQPQAQTFRWSMVATGGEPQSGGMGFANPDNLAIDGPGDLWMVTDISTTNQNRPLQRQDNTDSQNLAGIYGNNSLWYLPLQGDQAGQAFPFATAPMDSELTGPVFSRDQKTLFLAVQHPGEVNGLRQAASVDLSLTTTTGERFTQTRTLPTYSHWPGTDSEPARPAVVMIRRVSGGAINTVEA